MDEEIQKSKSKKGVFRFINCNKNRENKLQKKIHIWSLSTILLVVVLVAVFFISSGFTLDHISRTNPNFCATCHNMTEHVELYLTSNHLDNLHFKANVGCKDCHSDYTIPEELTSAVSFISGNYDVPFEKIIVKNDMCFQCHISDEYLGNNTDFLPRNPHRNHNIGLRCTVCHVSHDNQVDYCSECHSNGGQRMTGDPVESPRIIETLIPSGQK